MHHLLRYRHLKLEPYFVCFPSLNLHILLQPDCLHCSFFYVKPPQPAEPDTDKERTLAGGQSEIAQSGILQQGRRPIRCTLDTNSLIAQWEMIGELTNFQFLIRSCGKLSGSCGHIITKIYTKFQSSRSSLSVSVEHLCVPGSCAVQCSAAQYGRGTQG